MFKNTKINEVMTRELHGIEPHETVLNAKKRMAEFGIRHLPVRSGGKVVGMISNRDIALLEVFDHIDIKHTIVGKVMTVEPFTVRAEDLLSTVCQEMSRQGLGAAIVVDHLHNALGIFTEHDAIKVLAEMK